MVLIIICLGFSGLELKNVSDAFGSIRARSNSAFVAGRDEGPNDGDGVSTEDDEAENESYAPRPRKRGRPQVIVRPLHQPDPALTGDSR